MRVPIAIAAAVAAGLLLAACGSSDGGPVLAGEAGAGDDGSAVAASGADSAIVESGDGRPEDEVDAATVVVVTIDVPPEIELAGLAVVSLEDISYADEESVEIATVRVPAADLRNQDNQVEVFLPLPLDGSIDVTATVHIDVDESGTVSQGDWISPDLAMVGTGEAASVTVSVVPV